MEPTPITVSKIREATRGDPVLSRVMYCILHGWSPKENVPEDLKFYFNQQDEFSFEDGCLPRGSRVVIPAKYQASVLSELHLNHAGMVVELGPRRDCANCQRNRCKGPIIASNPCIWPNRPWQRIHVDFAGPLKGYMFLIVVDAKSKWIEVFPMSSITARQLPFARFVFCSLLRVCQKTRLLFVSEINKKRQLSHTVMPNSFLDS